MTAGNKEFDMIDLHTHILPNVDDGADGAQTALALINAEKDQGVSEIVFTPHYYGQKISPEKFLYNRRIAFEKIADKIDSVKVRMGAEVYFDEIKATSNKDLCSLAIEGTKCLLLELPFTPTWSDKLFFRLRDFIITTDYTPIIAHVERYPAVQKNPAYLSILSDMGCLLQVNTRSFTFEKTKGLAFAMLKKGFVSCLGTDTHNLTDRAPDYAQARKAVEDAGYKNEWETVFLTMRKILDGQTVVSPAYKQIKRIFNKYF